MKLTETIPCKRILAALLVAAATLGGSANVAHADDALAAVKDKGVLTVATEARFAPFEYVENGEIVGYSADVLKHIMEALPGVKLERLDLPFQGILAGLEANKYAYVVTSLTATKERADRYWLSAPIADATYAFVKKSGDSSINSPMDLGGKTIGIQGGSAMVPAVDALNKKLEAAGKGFKAIKEYTDFNEAYADLVTGRVDAVPNSLPNLLALEKERGDVFDVIPETFGPKRFFVWAGLRDANSIDLNRFIDAELRKLNQSGVLEQLQEKWIGGAVELPLDLPEPKS